MRSRHRSALATAVATITAAFAAAPAVDAATLHVTPSGGTIGPCALATPCSLEAAVAAAAPGDDVSVGPGQYDVTTHLHPADDVDVHGIYGQPRPFITGSGGLELGPASSAVYLGILANGAGDVTLELDGATGKDLVVWAQGGAITAVQLRAHTSGSLLQDAVVLSDVPTGEVVQLKDSISAPGGSATLLSTTVVGTGGARGIQAKVDNGIQRIINTIAWGAPDIDVKGTQPLFAQNSNFRPATPTGVSSEGGNQTDKPCFVGPDDFRPIAISPTIDAGIADIRLVDDAWGRPHSPPDIGALEYVPANDALGDVGCFWDEPEPEPPTDDSGTDDGDTSTPPPTDDPGSTTTPPAGDSSAKPQPTGDPTPVTPTSGGSTPTALPPATPPVLGTSVTLGESKGQLTVRLPGTNTFVPLTADSTVPVGSVIDATNGTVELTSVRDASGKTQTGQFWGGQFKVQQTRDRYTELVLSGPDLSCKKSKSSRNKRAAAPRTRSLWGRDKNGRFRTRGRHGTATVRGTRWLTQDRCDGTLFRVTEGAIDVRDDAERRTVRLKAGARYLADDAPAPKKKKTKRSKSR